MAPFSLSILMFLSLASLSTSCTEQEKSSLLQFVSNLSQDGGLTSLWENATDCCKWEGIICSSDRMVVDVLMASRGLQGHISASLGNLTGLQRLNLSHNMLSGGLPQELVSSNSILVVDVSFNQLNGDLNKLQPSDHSVRPLQVLNISSNLFAGSFPSTTWEMAKNLVVLNASNNSFTGRIPTSFCVSAPSFSVFELSYNQFSGRIPPELGNCSMLKSLNAGHNQLSGVLPDQLFNITLLKHLSLPYNQLQGPLDGISKLTNLAILDLGGNVISGNIPNSIGALKRLQEINLDYNIMSGSLPSTLGNCTDLRSINLRRNNFSEDLNRVNFSTLTNLQTLDLGWNKFTGMIPESIYSCSNLTALRLSSNNFHGQLSEKICSLKFLSFLSLVDNFLTNITSAFQIIRSCRNLTTLLLGHNFKHEAMPQDERIHGFESLQFLGINDCSLSAWMSNLNSLFLVDLSNNSLTGEIPTALMEMPMLKTDKVAPKDFQLPVYKTATLQYGKPTSFPEVLNLGDNNFTGAIPKEIGQLKALLSLNLSFNKLTGEIPQSICVLTNLQLLDLSSNHLQGELPSALNSMHFLSEFNISNNDLEGPIPISGQISTFLNSSFAGNPKLCGPMLAHHCGPAETFSPRVPEASGTGPAVPGACSRPPPRTLLCSPKAQPAAAAAAPCCVNAPGRLWGLGKPWVETGEETENGLTVSRVGRRSWAV